MTDINTKYEIRNEKDSVSFEQKVVKTMTMDEAFKECEAFKQQHLKVKDKKAQLEKEINDNVLENELIMVNKELEKLKVLEEEWTEVLKPYVEEIKLDARKFIKVKKAELGYKRVKDNNQKMVMQARIMAEFCKDRDYDVSHPALRALRPEFDKI